MMSYCDHKSWDDDPDTAKSYAEEVRQREALMPLAILASHPHQTDGLKVYPSALGTIILLDTPPIEGFNQTFFFYLNANYKRRQLVALADSSLIKPITEAAVNILTKYE